MVHIFKPTPAFSSDIIAHYNRYDRPKLAPDTTDQSLWTSLWALLLSVSAKGRFHIQALQMSRLALHAFIIRIRLHLWTNDDAHNRTFTISSCTPRMFEWNLPVLPLEFILYGKNAYTNCSLYYIPFVKTLFSGSSARLMFENLWSTVGRQPVALQAHTNS